jgi:Putative polyhydroxyalkanoic acid system protein (PHA_gran_rgn)
MIRKSGNRFSEKIVLNQIGPLPLGGDEANFRHAGLLRFGSERVGQMNRRKFITIGCSAAVVPTPARAEQAAPASGYNQFAVSIPHHLPRPEALRRLKSGLAALQLEYSYLFAIQEEQWSGYHLCFRASVMGQPANGTIDVTTGAVSLIVVLPWLFAILARAAQPLSSRRALR